MEYAIVTDPAVDAEPKIDAEPTIVTDPVIDTEPKIDTEPTIETLPSRAGDDGVIQPYERNLSGDDPLEIAMGSDNLSPEIYQTFGGADFGDQAADRAADQAAERVEATVASKAPADPAP